MQLLVALTTSLTSHKTNKQKVGVNRIIILDIAFSSMELSDSSYHTKLCNKALFMSYSTLPATLSNGKFSFPTIHPQNTGMKLNASHLRYRETPKCLI